MNVSPDMKLNVLRKFVPELTLCVCALALVAWILFMFYYDDVVDSSRFSNRSLFFPGLASSSVFAGYLSWRLNFVPWAIRAGIALSVVFFGYIAIGYALIVLNMWLDFS